jgi:hypothetical protein
MHLLPCSDGSLKIVVKKSQPLQSEYESEVACLDGASGRSPSAQPGYVVYSRRLGLSPTVLIFDLAIYGYEQFPRDRSDQSHFNLIFFQQCAVPFCVEKKQNLDG